MTIASRRRSISLLVLLAVSTLASQARADDTGDTESEGESLVRQGIELRTEGRNRDALTAFQQARVLSPTPRVQAQIALAHQALGEWVLAARTMDEALRDASDPWFVRYRGALEDARRIIRAHVGTLRVEWDIPDADLRIDDGVALRLPMTDAQGRRRRSRGGPHPVASHRRGRERRAHGRERHARS